MTAETFFHLRASLKYTNLCMSAPKGEYFNNWIQTLDYLTLTLTVASVLSGVGCASSRDSFCVRGTTVVMCSVLFTGFPIGPNITQEAQSSAAAQLAIPHSMVKRRVDYPGALWEETGRLMWMIWAPSLFIPCNQKSSAADRYIRRSDGNRTKRKHIYHTLLEYSMRI